MTGISFCLQRYTFTDTEKALHLPYSRVFAKYNKKITNIRKTY